MTERPEAGAGALAAAEGGAASPSGYERLPADEARACKKTPTDNISSFYGGPPDEVDLQ